jgi:hypothetical protein
MTPALTDPEKWEALVNGLFEKRWIPYVKETFNGRGNAIRYLARYSFRTAISNSRIVSYDDKNVTYSYKDYKNGGVIKQLTVPGEEFVRRYLLHILPPYFNRIRFSGYLTNCKKTFYLKLIHRLRNSIYPGDPYRKMNIEELMKALYNRDICVCARCGGRTKAVCRGRPKRSTLLFQELLADFVAE